MIEISALRKSFGQVDALRSIHLSVPAGQMAGIIGRSGAGKSTLLRVINRLAEPTSGTIAWKGALVSTLKGGDLRRWRALCDDISAVQSGAAP